jgi:histidine kinase/DNA gyrase B/HSP90-like ATPase
MTASPKWDPIILSAKVFGHISQGLYRSPAGAIKELISNAYDAGAEFVKIHTDFPRFSTFSCRDNGSGISSSQFKALMTGGIGNSDKRGPNVVPSRYGRPVIGRLGIGMLSLAQICTQFDVVSHHAESRSAFRATIKFPPYTRIEIDKQLKKLRSSEAEGHIQGGEYVLKELDYDKSAAGVQVFTKYLRDGFTRLMKELKTLGTLRSPKVPARTKISTDSSRRYIRSKHDLCFFSRTTISYCSNSR